VFGGSVNRIEGGGVFELTFPERINLFQNVNFASATVDSEYGHGNQYIRAHVLEVPTPTGHFTSPTVVDVHPDSPASTLDAAKAFFDDVSLFNCIPRVNGSPSNSRAFVRIAYLLMVFMMEWESYSRRTRVTTSTTLRGYSHIDFFCLGSCQPKSDNFKLKRLT